MLHGIDSKTIMLRLHEVPYG